MNNRILLILLLQGVALAAVDGGPSSETRIKTLRQFLGACEPSKAQSFLAFYSREFNADENDLRQDLATIARNTSIGILSRQQAFCAYAELAGDDALDFESTISSDDLLRRTCIDVAIRQVSDVDRGLELSKKWMLDGNVSDQGSHERQTIACAWMDVYQYGAISPEQKSSIIKTFREILNQATCPLPIVFADRFLATCDPEYTASGLRIETVGKWLSRTNDASVIFQDRYSRYFQKAAKECGLSLNPTLDPTEFTKDGTKQSETDGSGYEIPPGSRESADTTGSASPEINDGSRNPSPWCFAGLILPLGLAAWWIFRRK